MMPPSKYATDRMQNYNNCDCDDDSSFTDLLADVDFHGRDRDNLLSIKHAVKLGSACLHSA